MKTAITQRVYTLSDIFVNICKGAYWLSAGFFLLIFGRVVMLWTTEIFGLY